MSRRTIGLAALGAMLTLLAGMGITGTAGAAKGRAPSLGSNSRVNAEAPPPGIAGYVDNFPKNKQNEPSIARDPVTGAFVAGANDEIDLALCGQNPPWEPGLNDSVSCHF